VLRTPVLLGALATGLIALWLFFVAAVVVPARDPGHIGMWAGIATTFLAYALLTLAFVVRGPRPAWLPWAVGTFSLAAVSFGGIEVVDMVRAPDGRFEGYLLLMGAILAAQGLCALADTTVTSVIARRVRSAG